MTTQFTRLIPAIDDLVPGLMHVYEQDGTTEDEAWHLRQYVQAAEEGHRIIDLWVPAEAGTDDAESLEPNDPVRVMEVVDDTLFVTEIQSWHHKDNKEELFVESLLLR